MSARRWLNQGEGGVTQSLRTRGSPFTAGGHRSVSIPHLLLELIVSVGTLRLAAPNFLASAASPDLPGVALPATDMLVAHRSGGSCTTLHTSLKNNDYRS